MHLNNYNTVRAPDLPITTVASDTSLRTFLHLKESHRPVGTVHNSALLQAADHAEIWQQPFFFEDGTNNQINTQPSTCPSDFEFFSAFVSSPNEQASQGIPELDSDISRLPDPTNSFPFDLSASALPESRGRASLRGSVGQYTAPRSHETARTRTLDPTVFEGSNPEEIVLPLHLLKNYFPIHLSRDSPVEYVGSASAIANLFHWVNTMQLAFEIESLLCQCFDLSAENICERQTGRTGRGTSVSHGRGSPRVSIQRSRPHTDGLIGQGNQILPEMERKVTYHLMWAVPKGTIKLNLTSRADRSIINVKMNPQSIRVSFMPRDDERTTGITIDLKGFQGIHPGNALSRHIKTINVVPKDSEVIQCVLRNDLRSLQMLFDKREASPLDVDPQGFSLLSVSFLFSKISPHWLHMRLMTGSVRYVPWVFRSLLTTPTRWREYSRL